jgi:two-component system cell cycle sensor histidine kinase/response regulator CckA
MSPVRRGLARLRGPTPAPWADALFEAGDTARALLDGDGRILRTNAALAHLLGRPHTPDGAFAALFVPPLAALPPPGASTAAQARHADGRLLPLRLTRLAIPGPGALILLAPGAPDEATLARAARLQAVGALAGGIAHDFNNLLQAIGGAGEALAETPAMPTTAREELDRIAGGVARGAALVRQLLAFARQQTLLRQPVAVNPAVAAVANLLRRTLGESIRLDLRLEEPGRHVLIDPGQFDQVLLNLAVNARDAMPQGGVLTLSTGRRTVLAPTPAGEDTMPPGRYVVVEVRDTGHGIPPEVLPHIFEPFFTTRDSQARAGTGLGLATVHGIVRQSGGFIEVETAPGTGTSFRLLLPREVPPGQPAEAPPRTPPAEPDRATTGTILLVEDEAPVRRLAARTLSRRGWTVLEADSAEAALDLLDSAAPPCCIVTDLVMPGMDGTALVREARARLARPDLPAVLVSGYAEAQLREAVGSLHAAFLSKPYSLRDLADRVAALAGQGGLPSP